MQRIGLKEALAALRQELSGAIQAAASESLRFQVDEITLQFQVAVEGVTVGSGGIEFWVVTRSSSACFQVPIIIGRRLYFAREFRNSLFAQQRRLGSLHFETCSEWATFHARVSSCYFGPVSRRLSGSAALQSDAP